MLLLLLFLSKQLLSQNSTVHSGFKFQTEELPRNKYDQDFTIALIQLLVMHAVNVVGKKIEKGHAYKIQEITIARCTTECFAMFSSDAAMLLKMNLINFTINFYIDYK